MSYKTQYFAVDPDGKLERIPNRTLERITSQEARLPEHVGTMLKVAGVLTECDKRGVPKRVEKVSGFLIKLEEDGLMDEGSFLEGIRLVMNTINFEAPEDGPVVDLEDAREKRELERNHRWTPSPAETGALVAAALGHPKSTPNILAEKVDKTVSRIDRKNAERLTYRARQTISDLRSGIRDLNFKISILDAEDLENLERAVLEEEKDQESWSRAHWQAVAQHVRYRSAIVEAIQHGSGEWYAVVQAMNWERDNVAEVDFTKAEKYPTRDEATSAVRTMLAEAAHGMIAGVSIEAKTVPAIQWEEEGF
jgi:hypothetical protein